MRPNFRKLNNHVGVDLRCELSRRAHIFVRLTSYGSDPPAVAPVLSAVNRDNTGVCRFGSTNSSLTRRTNE